MGRCANPHPTLDLTCIAPDAYPNHDHHFAGDHEWPNENFVPPPTKPSREKREEVKANIAVLANGLRKGAKEVAEEDAKLASVEALHEPHAWVPSDPHPTQVEGAALSSVRNSTRRKQVLRVVAAAMDLHPPGVTDFEIAQVLDDEGLPAPTVAARRLELQKGYWVEPLMRDGQEVHRKNPHSGSMAIVWVLTPSAQDLIHQVEF